MPARAKEDLPCDHRTHPSMNAGNLMSCACFRIGLTETMALSDSLLGFFCDVSVHELACRTGEARTTAKVGCSTAAIRLCSFTDSMLGVLTNGESRRAFKASRAAALHHSSMAMPTSAFACSKGFPRLNVELLSINSSGGFKAQINHVEKCNEISAPG